MSNIKKVETINLNSIKFSKRVKNKNNEGKTSYINYGTTRDKFRVQLPKMSLPFGASISNKKKVEEGTEKPKYSLSFSFSGYEENHKLKQLKKTLESLDDKLLKVAREENWMGKNLSEEILREKLNPTVKWSYDDEGNLKDFPPSFKTTLPKKFGQDDAFNVTFFGADKSVMDITPDNVLDVITQGSHGRAIVECRGVYFIGKNFGISWNILQIQVYPNDTKLDDWAFTPESDDEDEVEDTKPKEDTYESAFASDSDSESEKPPKTQICDSSDPVDELVANPEVPEL